ncbi:hypothetical protein Micbo1qcDRAFT_159764, partial [Microdochium bolleyi]
MSARLILSRTARSTIRSHAYGAGIGLSLFGAAGSFQHFQKSSPASRYYLLDAAAGGPIAPGSRSFASRRDNNGSGD